MAQGHIAVAGRTLPITQIGLRDGKLQIAALALAARDMPAVHNAEATVFGADGQGICQGWRMDIPEVHAGETMTIILPIQIAELTLTT